MQAKKRSAKALKISYPDEPWHWRPDWHEGVIKSGTIGGALGVAVFGLIFVGLSLPGVLAIPDQLDRGKPEILVVLIFTVIGLGILWFAWREIRQIWRYGVLTYRPKALPGSWGGRVEGIFAVPKGAQVIGPVKLRLLCIHKRVTGSGKHRRTSEVEQWEAQESVSAEVAQGMGLLRELPIGFAVPRGRGRPTDLTDPKNQILWRLEVVVPVRRQQKPLEAKFEIPVFDLGEDLGSNARPSEQTPETARQTLSDAMVRAGVTQSQGIDGAVWRFDQPGVKTGAWALAAFAVGCGLSGWFVPVLILQVVFLGFAGLLLAILPGLIWRRSELRLSPREVIVEKRTWRGKRQWRFAPDEIADLTLEQSMTSGSDRYMRLSVVGVPGVDPETPHVAEHFKARKARFRWRREIKQSGEASENTRKALLETPCFELEIAGYLKGTMAAERVRDHLRDTIRRLSD